MYRHIPSNRLSPVGDLINEALVDVPKLPAFFNRNDTELLGISEARNKNMAKDQKIDSFFSKFMLERLKQSSILNHDCFKKNDVNHKAQVAFR